MKTKIFALILSCILIFNMGIVQAAESDTSIKEDTTAKFYIDGVVYKNSGTLILKNCSPMLSTDYLTALGIKSQVWDSSKKVLTLTKESTMLTLELNSLNFVLSGKKGTINVKPLTYKGKAYFPAELIATSFGYKFAHDTDINTYFIKNNADYEKNKALLNKILAAMNSIKKYRQLDNITINLSGKGVKVDSASTVSSDVNVSDKKVKASMKQKVNTNGILQNNNIQIYFESGKQYIKINGAKWMSYNTSAVTNEDQFKFNRTLKYNDVILSALTISKSDNKDEIVLKGNTMLGGAISNNLSTQQMNNMTALQNSFEILVDKNTNIMKKIVLKLSGVQNIYGQKTNLSLSYTVNYSDINGNFDVVMPDEIKNMK